VVVDENWSRRHETTGREKCVGIAKKVRNEEYIKRSEIYEKCCTLYANDEPRPLVPKMAKRQISVEPACQGRPLARVVGSPIMRVCMVCNGK
jgi:hypothetical protein